MVSSYKQVGVERRKKKQKVDWRRQSDRELREEEVERKSMYLHKEEYIDIVIN